MKHKICLLLAVLLILSLFGCRLSESAPTEDTAPTEIQPPTQAQSPTGSAPPPTTEPAHTELYLPDVPCEDMVNYFGEVVLNIEYTDGVGDASLVQKWVTPIHYRITGTPTDADLAVLEELFTQLNQIPGFPGIYASSGEEIEDLTISFLDEENFVLAFGSVVQGETADGAMQFWYYNDTNNIYSGRIGYRTDISQELRNSVLLEEIVNVLGITDTVLRSDSIVYQYSSEALQLSPVDWVILKLLYDPAMECGMDADACRTVLQQLYY